jgi:hypothetical protein
MDAGRQVVAGTSTWKFQRDRLTWGRRGFAGGLCTEIFRRTEKLIMLGTELKVEV